MEWMKHRCTEDWREFFDQVHEKFGHEGFSIWWRIQELLAGEMEAHLEEFRTGRAAAIHPLLTKTCKWLAAACKTTPATLREFAAFARLKGKYTIARYEKRRDLLTIEAPNMLRDNGEYFEKAVRQVCEATAQSPRGVVRLSGESPESVRTLSAKRRGEETGGDKRSEEGRGGDARAGGESVETPTPSIMEDVSPPPPAAPRAPAPSPLPPIPPASLALVESKPTEIRVDLPHAYSLALLLPSPYSFSVKQAGQIARSKSVAEIAAVLREAGGKQGPGAYAAWVFKHNHGAKRALHDEELVELRQKIRDFEKLYAVLRRQGEDAFEFAARNGAGIRMGAGGAMRAAP